MIAKNTVNFNTPSILGTGKALNTFLLHSRQRTYRHSGHWHDNTVGPKKRKCKQYLCFLLRLLLSTHHRVNSSLLSLLQCNSKRDHRLFFAQVPLPNYIPTHYLKMSWTMQRQNTKALLTQPSVSLISTCTGSYHHNIGWSDYQHYFKSKVHKSQDGRPAIPHVPPAPASEHTNIRAWAEMQLFDHCHWSLSLFTTKIQHRCPMNRKSTAKTMINWGNSTADETEEAWITSALKRASSWRRSIASRFFISFSWTTAGKTTECKCQHD